MIEVPLVPQMVSNSTERPSTSTTPRMEHTFELSKHTDAVGCSMTGSAARADVAGRTSRAITTSVAQSSFFIVQNLLVTLFALCSDDVLTYQGAGLVLHLLPQH